MHDEANLSVGNVAKRCGVAVSALHFYEQKGLIRSWRNQGNQRRYKRDVLRRIAVIKAAQKVGLTLDEIVQAFATLPEKRTPDKQDWANLSNRWQKMLQQRIRYMQALSESLDGCIGCGCLSLKNCPLYNPDDALAEQGSGAVLIDKAAENYK
ncbi:redox-sensitive transcriptional activator SoxR [Neptunicella marina]|uniref:Redox-sensitive transcriptional activator SoxR n=1 Tax=Neptunicella marina TaxID=2125989 RepID=A0A8J6M564_9ALTE|nr:redox-sensitive transcriptional activator SoxR [Neptunicella marina]MBC3766326.1 redox-sensitive transcriptional activator SoxR [Neptunicella marina]